MLVVIHPVLLVMAALRPVLNACLASILFGDNLDARDALTTARVAFPAHNVQYATPCILLTAKVDVLSVLVSALDAISVT